MRQTALLLLVALTASAEQLSIRLASQAQPNCWDVEDIVSTITKGAGSDREKALALHKFGMAHQIHFNGPIEERGQYIDDPLKLMAVYGFSLCGNNSKAMSALYNAAGMKARTRSMPGHSVPEVWFEGKWNYIDTDMFGYVFLEDGHRIASVDELTANADLFLKQKNPPTPFYPFDEKADMASVFRGAKPSRNHHPYSNAHLMNLGLRTGESIEFYYRPKNRYLLTELPADLGVVYKDYWVTGPVRKGSLAWTDEPPAAYGNAVVEYAPDLGSDTFAQENPERANVLALRQRRKPQLVAATAGERASVVLEVNTPFVIVGEQNDLTDFGDNSDAAVVKGLFWRTAAEDENRISVSIDAGRTWTKVWENRYLGAIPFEVDLTRWVEGRYSYRVKFEWVDPKGSRSVGLENLAVRTWVEVSPMGLPRLVAGKNRFQLETAPRRTFYHESYWHKGQNLREQRAENLVFDAKRSLYRPQDAARPASMTFRLGPDGVAEELRFSVSARALGAMDKVSLALAMSADGGATWREVAQFQPDPEHNQNQMWFNHILRGVKLDGVRTWLRLTASGAAIEKIVANTALPAAPAAESALEITHQWYEGSRLQTAARTLASRGSYEIETSAGPIRNHALRIRAVAKAN
jgi:hypothetical protein